jgi:hypothetical protein
MTMLVSFARKVLDVLKRRLEIHSPSRVWIDWRNKPIEPRIEYVHRWYDPHYPWEPWGDVELRRAPRLVRRAKHRTSRKELRS